MSEDVGPRAVRDPISRVHFDCGVGAGASQEEPPEMLAQFLFAEFYVAGEHEGEEEFVFFEEGAADVFVERVSEVVDEVEQSAFKLLGRQGVLDCQLKEVDEPLQGVLVHWVDSRKVDDAEEQQTGPKGNASIALTGLVYLLFSYFGVLNPLVDFLCELLAVLELVDEGLIQQQLGYSSASLRQADQNVVFDVQQFFLIGCVSFDDVFLFLLQLRVLQSH